MSNIFRLARETLFGNAVQEKAKKEAAIDELRTSPGIDEHQIDERHLLHKYGCRINDGPDADHVPYFGLSGNQREIGSRVHMNSEKYGANTISPPPQRTKFARFMTAQTSGFAPAMYFAAILMAIAYASMGEDANNLYAALLFIAISCLSGAFETAVKHELVDVFCHNTSLPPFDAYMISKI